MLVLGIETSCDECSVAVVENGRKILSNVIATQIETHKPYSGVVPEIASRLHTEWIVGVYKQALVDAGIDQSQLDAVAVTNRPGLVGSLLVGVGFAKSLAATLGIPVIGIDHIRAHLYAPQLESEIAYPYLGLLVSGGHTMIAKVTSFDDFQVLGTTIDDACGEAFDKVAKFYGLGYPGGVIIDKLSKEGDPKAFNFPKPSLHKGNNRYNVSYSGLKNAVTNQIDQFWNREYEKTPANIAASFQRTAVDILLGRLKKAIQDTGLSTVVAGGGVAANSYLRQRLESWPQVEAYYPSLTLCTDNGAMVGGIAYHYLERGDRDGANLSAYSRVKAFRHTYP
ncbi:tRNA (adenosine(37)-N6)-threonylcarbamoyltransferase complex transferase subunit TsaD [Spirochaeta cellobiosiphila]|uniref:tRNA (adenosine(37)-N6)-threonylcarbamoyltransferase complex transferase subunit TsaD n=1 Tax=Spirochaeta cellobiosiphila TaxID=504483 RepID=UPI0003FEFA2C|nr:tRNA (adenosine(37)-N6)-threonylcarbamoyltransferase complex transferase subunit TsaD [Spirochaeta cellobiosiphila]